MIRRWWLALTVGERVWLLMLLGFVLGAVAGAVTAPFGFLPR